MAEFVFKQIGIIRSPHTDLSKIPIQPVFCKDIRGRVVLDREYIPGLKSLDGFSHIHLFYFFNSSDKTKLQLAPYLSDETHGIFSTRAPHRPNKLGMSLVELVGIEDNILHINGVDILDNTPLVDIKPYIQRFDAREQVRSGWQDSISDNTAGKRGLRDFPEK